MSHSLVPKHHLGIQGYKPGKPLEQIRREFGLSGFAKLASNENTLGPSPLAIKALLSACAMGHWYPDPNSLVLKEALSQHLGIPSEMIHLGNGSEEILCHAARCFLQDGEEVVLSKNSFPIYSILNRFQNAKEIVIPDRNYSHDLHAMARAVTKNTRLVWLCNPNNPTGTWFSHDDLKAFLDSLCGSPVVILDEAYYEFAKDHPEFPNSLSLLNAYPNLIITRTFSKAYGLAGIRIGYSMQSAELTTHLNRIRLPFHINSLAQIAATAALQDTDFLQKTLNQAAKGRSMFLTELPKMGYLVVPSLTNFSLVTGPANFGPLVSSLMKRGVVIRPLSLCNENDAVRITTGTDEENQMLLDALRQI